MAIKAERKHHEPALVAILIATTVSIILSSCDIPRSPPPTTRHEEPAISQATPPSGKTVYDFINEGDTTAFLLWLSETPDLNTTAGKEGATPLIAAVLAQRADYISDLLSHGADKDISDESGQTALHHAARAADTGIMSALITAGANPLVTDKQGLTPLDAAVASGNQEAVRLITDAQEAYRTSHASSESPTDATGDAAITPAVLLSTDFRIWTSTSGDRIDAAFIQNVFDTVILQNREGTMVRIGLNRLIPDDQILVRKLSGIDPVALARVRGTSSAPAKSARKSGDSIALRIGNSSGWTVLEDCRLLQNSANDGDSFHVRHDGKEYIFRLYFVDAAETEAEFPERVKDQSAYFKLDKNDTLKLGHEAAKFTRSILAAAPFTAVTKWEDARGNSELPRHYAMIVTPMGDLDELLTREGLVRQYGMTIDNNLGSKKESDLRRLEQEAKQHRAGAWGRMEEHAGP